ncbi:diacylglycerol/lipid kinase family protein [Arthrobacter sp. TMN-37]
MNAPPPAAPDRGPALLIVNPASGRGRSTKFHARVAAALAAEGYDVAEHVTTGLADARAAAAGAAPGTLVASLGGDGLHGAVAAGVMGTGAVLLALGGGRGNDTVRRLGLPVHPVRAVRSVPSLAARPLDLGCVNGVPFLGVAHIGFDGLAAELANASRIGLGPLSYLAGGVRALLTWKGVAFAVGVDGVSERFTGWFVAVGNVGQYGGGIRIAPHAAADDGLLDVVRLRGGGRVRLASVFLRAFGGAHLAQPGIASTRGRRVDLTAAPGLNVYADGELVGPVPAEITLLPSAVLVLVPPSSPALLENAAMPAGQPRPRGR